MARAIWAISSLSVAWASMYSTASTRTLTLTLPLTLTLVQAASSYSFVLPHLLPLRFDHEAGY